MRPRFFAACLLLLSSALVYAAPEAAPPRATARNVLTLADAPLRLIRGATVYTAANGVALQRDDILETADGGAQVEAGPDAIVALGPHTRVLLASLPSDGRGLTELALLRGWVKLRATSGPATVTSPVLQVNLASGSTIVRAGDGQDAVFAEEGAQQVIRTTDGPARGKAVPLKLAFEQYAALEPGKPQPVAGRPPHAFVAALPPAFRDRLARVPNLPNAGKVKPVKEREADFADVGPWLQAPLPERKKFVTRFRPRLADPAFRKALDDALGQSAEWKPVLHPSGEKS